MMVCFFFPNTRDGENRPFEVEKFTAFSKQIRSDQRQTILYCTEPFRQRGKRIITNECCIDFFFLSKKHS